MGAAVAGIQAAGAGLSAYGNYRQGIAQKKYYENQAAASELEANLTEKAGQQEATFAENEGASQGLALARKSAELRGTQRAALAGSGIAGSVTANDIATDTESKINLDKMAIKYNADLKAWKADQDARNRAHALRQQAIGYKIASKESEKAGKIGAATSLLGGAAQVADTTARYSRYAKT